MSGGVGAAVSEAVGEADDGQDLVEAVQASLFELDQEDTGDLDSPSPFSQSLTPKRGRPKGSRNVRTTETLRWLLAQHRHPLAVIMEAYSMSPEDFARSIKLPLPYVRELVDGKWQSTGRRADGYDAETLLEVVKIQLRMAEAALPYVAQKQPMAVQLEGKAALTVSFSGVSLPARGGQAGDFQRIEGESLGVRLPFKSDDGSRTDG